MPAITICVTGAVGNYEADMDLDVDYSVHSFGHAPTYHDPGDPPELEFLSITTTILSKKVEFKEEELPQHILDILIDDCLEHARDRLRDGEDRDD